MNEYPRIVRAYMREGFQMKVVFEDGLAGVVDLKKTGPPKISESLTEFWGVEAAIFND